MRNNGFTLIELLAVIVILAIIALIATPIVLNIIEDSKDSSKLNSTNHYVDAVEQAIMRYNMDSGGNFIPKECEIQSSGNVKCVGKEIVVEVDGEKPISGTITFELGNIVDVRLDYGEKYIVYDEKGMLIYGDRPKIYANGEIVYYNVDTGKTCLESEAVSATGTKSGCMKFYAFNDSEENEIVTLILDHNTTAMVAWTNTSTDSNANGPIDVLNALYNDTKNWVGTITPKDYEVDQSTQDSGAKYTVEYSKTPNIEGATTPYKTRLITAQEVSKIIGADDALNWDETLGSSVWYYFHDLSQAHATGRGDVCAISGCAYGWLYDRTTTDCTKYGCLNNSDAETSDYWTATSNAAYSYLAWSVRRIGHLYYNYVHYERYGVRPVIEVLKSKLS